VYLLNEVSIPRYVIAFALGRSERWVNTATLRVDLQMRRLPKFEAEVRQLERKLATALQPVIQRYPML
jgi:hypothetical protein